ncbi:alpha/beta fold hydrolase [Caulobacter sp. 17J65-9]|uniref:alpha/beta fold hydrolase n=1 Tax=Caulobacter sp. 17J65-9 TaxID=2709382 RepID=UPI0013C86F29|nr:alpha/beta hydrolase [Caulobacter sp. 17J65-9]
MRRTISVLAAALWFAAGCGSAQARAAQPASDDFKPCADAAGDAALAGSLCARFSAPLSYADPGRGQIDLFVREFPAKGRSKGQVWLVAGGPGESGATFYSMLATFRAAFPGYDLMVPDHRGTGFSTRLCPKEEAVDSEGGAALQGAEWATCFGSLETERERAHAFTITNAAQDLRRLVDRYGDRGKTWIYGVSYGTQLVLRTMAVAPPRKVDGIVLDSLVPPETTQTWDLSRRSAVVDEVGRKLLADCDAGPACREQLGGSAVAAMQAVVDDPKLAAAVPGGKPKLFFGALLDFPELRARIPSLLAALRAGDAAPLVQAEQDLEALGAGLMRFPQSPSSIPLVAMISASENNARQGLTKAQVEAEAANYLFVSPLAGQLVGAASMAYPRDDAFGKPPARLPRLLVVQGDMDPKTPYAGAEAHVEALRAAGQVSLVKVGGAPHFVLFTAPDCFTRAVKPFVEKRRAKPKACSID